MRWGMPRGFATLAMLAGALGIGAAAHAAPPVNMAKLCSNGAYVLYMDDNGDQFASEAACVAWTQQHPGQPPTAIDNDPDGHPDQPVSVNTDDPDVQSGDASSVTTDDADAQSGATPTADNQSTPKTVLVIVTDPPDAGVPAPDDDSDNGEG